MSKLEKQAIILGATGAVGKALLGELMAAPHYAQVHAFVRRPFKEKSSYSANDKLVEHILDFEKLLSEKAEGAAPTSAPETDKLRHVGAEAEAVYITLGTTRAAAGGTKQFERIDREYVLAAARAAVRASSGDTTSPQRVLYCSSQAANSKSSFPYMKSKGLTEEGLASAGYSDCILFRPGFLGEAKREKTRYLEMVYGVVVNNIIARFSNEAEIKIPLLAKAMLVAGTLGSAGLQSKGVGSAPGTSFTHSNSKAAATSTVTVVANGEAKHLAAQS